MARIEGFAGEGSERYGGISVEPESTNSTCQPTGTIAKKNDMIHLVVKENVKEQ